MEQFIQQRVSAEEDGGLLREFLRERLGLSKKQITRLKNQPGGILADGQPVTVRHQLRCGETISVLTDVPRPSSAITPQALPLSIVYEDDALLVVDKPAHLVIYPSYAGHRDNLASGVLAHWQANGGPAVFRPLMRLDKDTTGLVAIAKNAYVQAQLQKTGIRKEYLAWAGGDLAQGGVIEAPIAKGSGCRREVRADGRCACTVYEVLYRQGTATLLCIRLLTGRTHQIRVHLAYIGHPLLGDALYGGDCTYWQRQALHAWQLSLRHPLDGRQMQWRAPFSCGAMDKDIVLSGKDALQIETDVLK